MLVSQNAPYKQTPRGFWSVFAALLGNLSITVMKFAGYALSGSAAMFSEGIHSLADMLNQALLMVGIRRSARRADEEFSYGYGSERFIWALISACGIFFIGAGVTIYQGVVALVEYREIETGTAVYIILAVSLAIESATFLFAFREFRKASGGKEISEALEYGDPATIAILYEDGAAVIGVIIAFFGIWLSSLTNSPLWDAVGSIMIGVLLGAIAVLLINKNREFLVGKAIPEELKDEIVSLLEADPAIEKVIDFKSSIINVGEYRIKCEVEFNGPALLKEIRAAGDIREEYEEIKNDYDEFLRFAAEFIDRIPRLMGKRIDEIEKKIQTEVPGVRHIDIEIN